MTRFLHIQLTGIAKLYRILVPRSPSHGPIPYPTTTGPTTTTWARGTTPWPVPISKSPKVFTPVEIAPDQRGGRWGPDAMKGSS